MEPTACPAFAEERFVPYSSDVVIKHRSKEHLAQYDQYFKRFQHSKALDAALSVSGSFVPACVLLRKLRSNL